MSSIPKSYFAPPQTGILEEIRKESVRQFEKWGLQNHPSVDQVLNHRPGGATGERMCGEYEIPTEHRAKFLCDTAAKNGSITWAHIAVEELSEAVSARTTDERRAELIQLAAVVFSWIDSIDRNGF